MSPRLLPALLLPILAWGAAGCGAGEEPAGEPSERLEALPLQIAVTLPPLAWFAERLAGGDAVVEVLIPPGADPHTFEPAPRQMMALARARLVVQVGHPALPFESRFVEQVRRQNPETRIVTLASDRQAAGEDPHLWVDPGAVRPLIVAIAGALSELDPPGADLYASRQEAMERELVALDAELRALLAGCAGRAFLVQHPTWGAFAQRYGLEQLAIEAEGKEPGPRRLARLVEEARQKEVQVVLVQRGMSDKAARAAAREIGARVAEADPLARDWPDALREAARALAAQAPEPPG